MRSLGLDIGDRRIGVAISDPSGFLASPLTIVVRDDDEKAIAKIIKFLNQYQVGRVVVGLPYLLDGSFGEQARKTAHFTEKLSKQAGIDIESWDERFSTVAAEGLMIEAGMRKAKRKSQRDAAAAALILQGYLDSLTNSAK